MNVGENTRVEISLPPCLLKDIFANTDYHYVYLTNKMQMRSRRITTFFKNSSVPETVAALCPILRNIRPQCPITREQLAVMLWRYVGSPAVTNKEPHFINMDTISSFVVELCAGHGERHHQRLASRDWRPGRRRCRC